MRYTLTDNKSKHNEILKVIAIVSMFIDHVGYGFFPEYEFLRWIGRLAFPIFAYQLANGYIYTSNKKKYMVRLWIFALIAQIPYMLYFDTPTPNILFTLLLSILLIDRIHKIEYYWIPTFLILSIIIPFDYGWYGLLTPLIFYLFRKSNGYMILAHTGITALYVAIGDIATIQILALLSIFICLYFPKDKWKVHLNKTFFYWFYPAHITLLLLIKFTLMVWIIPQINS